MTRPIEGHSEALTKMELEVKQCLLEMAAGDGSTAAHDD